MKKVALIGAGTMGRTHCNAYFSIEDAKLVAVCDINEEKANMLCEKHGAKSYKDYETMISMRNLIFSTSVFLHIFIQSMQLMQ